MTMSSGLEAWRGRHRGETILVCGCGKSLSALKEKPPCPVIGVNDVGRQLEPDYLMVVNPSGQFSPQRFAAIEATRARALFTSVADLGVSHPQVVRFGLGIRGGTRPEQPGRLPYTRNSPYMALALAVLMGARRIGLIGVDFTRDHFFGPTGNHPLAGELRQIDDEYGRLAAAAQADGVEIVNLSAESRLTALPRMSLADFLGALKCRRRKVLHISKTNCAGAIWNLHRLMNASGRAESRVATASAVTSGRHYPQDIRFSDMEGMRAAIRQADILHFHNYVDHKSPALAAFAPDMRDKPAVLQLHSEPAVIIPHFPGRDPRTRRDLPVLVVAQKQARFYPQARPVLNALVLDDFAGAMAAGPAVSGLPRIVYTPTDQKDYPTDPPTCRGKGYRRTVEILNRLAGAGIIEPVVRTDLAWADAMALSRGASAKIDECVTGGYHLTSLEALAQGLATFAWLDPETRRLLAEMTGSDEASLPWVSVQIDGLEARLTAMAARPADLAPAGAAGQAWMRRYWTVDAILAPILSAYERAQERHLPALPPRRVAGKPGPTKPSAPPARAKGATGPGTISTRIPGKARPYRSLDFAQRVYLSSALLSRAGSLAGQTVHVLGNGPSLNDADLGSLSGDCVIGVNASVRVEDRLGRVLDYYCVSDRRFVGTPEGRAMAMQARRSMRVFAGYCEGFLPDNDINYVRIRGGDGASDDLRTGLFHGFSVVLFAGQLAAWLGAAEVRLHGMECDYRNGRFDSSLNGSRRPNDHGIYGQVAASAGALASLLAAGGGRLSVAGPSRLTGGFGATAVAGVAALPIAAARQKQLVAAGD